jgi:hypothetical protein
MLMAGDIPRNSAVDPVRSVPRSGGGGVGRLAQLFPPRSDRWSLAALLFWELCEVPSPWAA